MVADLVIALPAWGSHYVETAIRYTIPAAKAAIARRAPGRKPPLFIVHTDSPRYFAEPLREFETWFFDVPPGSSFAALTYAHADALDNAPSGATVALLNSDIVVSVEAFAFAEAIFDHGFRVLASVGVRSLVGVEPPPIGATGRHLLEWCWRNRHPITEDSVWGRGKTHLPTCLFYETAGNVVLHCFHLCPVLLRKDRALSWRGTIDDQLIGCYPPNEVFVPLDREVGFAELSPSWKVFHSGARLTHDAVSAFWKRRFRFEHLRNFKHAIRVAGDGSVDNSPAIALAAELEQWGRRIVRR